MTAESREKLAGQKGGLTKQIRTLELAGQHVPADLRNRMEEVTRKLRERRQGVDLRAESEDDGQSLFGSDDGPPGPYPDRKKKDDLGFTEGSRKRKASMQPSFTGVARKAKMTKARDEAGLDFVPAEDMPAYVPASLVTPAANRLEVNLPVILTDGNEVLELTTKIDEAGLNKTFWTALTERVKQLSPLLDQHQFNAISAEDLEMLKLGSAMIPELLGSSGRLLYEAKSDRITKANYKAYLTTVGFNLKTLLDNMAETKQSASLTQGLTRSKVSSDLQSGLQGKSMMSVAEHSKILQGQVGFQHAAIEVVRRELVSYGMVISNLAEQTKKQRMELAVIARFIQKQLGQSGPISEGGDTKLPTVMLTVGLPGKHLCRCPSCDPKFSQELELAAAERAEDSYAARLEDSVKREMRERAIARFREEVAKDAKQEVRRQLKAEILSQELVKYKSQLEKEVQEDFKEATRKELTSNLEAGYQRRFKDMLSTMGS